MKTRLSEELIIYGYKNYEWTLIPLKRKSFIMLYQK